MKKSLVVSATTFYILLTTYSAGAVGVAVKPAELTVQATVNQTTSMRLQIKNPSNEVALFQVYPEEFDTMISAMPAKLTLQAAEEREVVIQIKAQKEGQYDTHLAVVARPLDDPTFGIASGAKVPLHIQVVPAASGLALISDNLGGNLATGILFALLAAAALYIWSLRKKLAAAKVRAEN